MLAESRGQHTLRAARSLLLARAAEGRDVAQLWLERDPDNPDARLLYARTLAAGALNAHAAADGRTAAVLGKSAAKACLAAAEAGPADPTPYIAVLTLTPLGYQPAADPYGLAVRGPWDLWERIAVRDPVSAEGHRQLLIAVSQRHGGSHADMWTVARWAARSCPDDSDPQLLTLAAYAEHYRARRDDLGAAWQWQQQAAVETVTRIHRHWFARVRSLQPPYVPVEDLSLLAHALLATGDPQLAAAAGQVLQAMLPYAHRHPWELFGDPAAQLDAVRHRLRTGPR